MSVLRGHACHRTWEQGSSVSKICAVPLVLSWIPPSPVAGGAMSQGGGGWGPKARCFWAWHGTIARGT